MTLVRDAPAVPRALVVDADPALLGLLEEWLEARGCSVSTVDDGRFDLIAVDVPYPRRDGAQVLQRLAALHPGTPVIVLSSGLFNSYSSGALARELGVASVLPKPVARADLVGVVDRLLPSR